jgi:hypothetical protein
VLATPRSLRSRAEEALLVLSSPRHSLQEEEEFVEVASSRGEVEAARLVLMRPSSKAGAATLVEGQRGARNSTHVLLVLHLCRGLPRHPALQLPSCAKQWRRLLVNSRHKRHRQVLRSHRQRLPCMFSFGLERSTDQLTPVQARRLCLLHLHSQASH